MKKVFAILLIVLAVSASAQSNATITIITTDPTVACRGGTMNVMVTLIPEPSTPYQLSLFLINADSTATVWSAHYTKLYTYKKQFTTKGDTVYLIPIKIPLGFPAAVSYIENGTQQVTVKVDQCVIQPTVDVTGIQKHSMSPKEIIYFDLNGRRIEPRYNEVMIIQQGLTRRKVIMQQ